MSVVYTADIFCDGHECLNWITGVTSETPPLKKDARAVFSKLEGWTRKGSKDFCPSCSTPVPTGKKE